jgi:hypothetical protein
MKDLPPQLREEYYNVMALEIQKLSKANPDYLKGRHANIDKINGL